MNELIQSINQWMIAWKKKWIGKRTNDQTTGRMDGWMGADRTNEQNEIKNE